MLKYYQLTHWARAEESKIKKEVKRMDGDVMVKLPIAWFVWKCAGVPLIIFSICGLRHFVKAVDGQGYTALSLVMWVYGCGGKKFLVCWIFTILWFASFLVKGLFF